MSYFNFLGEKQKMVNLRKAAIRIQKANSIKEVNNKRLRISPTIDQSQEYRQNGMDSGVDTNETGCFLNSLCFGTRQRKRRRLQFSGASREKNNGNGGNDATYRGRRQFTSTNQK